MEPTTKQVVVYKFHTYVEDTSETWFSLKNVQGRFIVPGHHLKSKDKVSILIEPIMDGRTSLEIAMEKLDAESKNAPLNGSGEASTDG